MAESNGNDRMAEIESALLRLTQASLQTQANIEKMQVNLTAAYDQFQRQFRQVQEETGSLDQRLRAGFFERERTWMEEARAREKRMDERIEKLVSAMGTLVTALAKPSV